MNHDHPPNPPSFWRSRSGIVLLAFLAIAGFFLVTEHRAHLFGWLPFILLALCPLMHIFGHGGHGNDSGPSAGESRRGGGHEH